VKVHLLVWRGFGFLKKLVMFDAPTKYLNRMRTILLTHGFIAKVDDEDFPRLNKFDWSVRKVGKRLYAVRSEKSRRIYMQKMILNVPRSVGIRFANGDGLDVRRENLRVRTSR
jgi:hypothetical protein